MKRLLVAAALMATACGDGGFDESVSGVFPPQAFLNSSIQLLISGSGTNWDDSTEVRFVDQGAVEDISLVSKIVPSPTAILMEVTVSSTATVGPRTITVDGAPYEGGFTVLSPLSATVFGTQAQGSLVQVFVENIDSDNPFTNVGIGLGEGNIDLQFGGIRGDLLDFTAYLDVNEALGPVDLLIQNGTPPDATTFTIPGVIDIQARTPVPFPANGAETFVEPLESELYVVNGGLNPTYQYLLAIPQQALGSFIVLGPTGNHVDVVGGGDIEAPFLAEANTDYYAILYHNGGGLPANFTVGYLSGAVTKGVETEPTNNANTGADVVVSGDAIGGDIGPAVDDSDWFEITIPAIDDGKVLQVLTLSGDPLADTFLQMYSAPNAADETWNATEGTTEYCVASPTWCSSDANFHETFVSPQLTGGATYYVQVSWSRNPQYVAGYNAEGAAYHVAFEIQDP
jgi:hypothetical protein